MADFSNIENQIDNAITTNGVGAITGAILNAILKGMLSAVDGAKEDTLTFDLTPTEDSTHPVTSGGVYDALEAAAQAVATALADYYTKTQADTLLSAKADDADVVHLTGNENINGVKTFTDTIGIGNGIDMNGTKVEDLGTPTADTDAATKKYVDDGLATKQDTLTIDAVPTDDSDNPVASNGVYDALAGKQDTIGDLATIRSGAAAGATAVQPATMQAELAQKQDTLTFDAAPTAGSTNPVESQGVKTALDDKANTDGYYERMTVGTAQNLVGRGSVDAEYTFRTSGGTADIGTGAATIERIKGNTIVWNQLTRNPYEIDFDIDNSQGTSLTYKYVSTNPYITFGKLTIGHKYYISVDAKFTSSDTYNSFYTTENQSIPLDIGTRIWTCNTNNGGILRVKGLPVGKHITGKFTMKLVDLTLIFGAGNEPSTVEEFEALYPLNYYAYNEGELVSNKALGIETVGFNLFDPSTGKAYIPQATNGDLTDGTNCLQITGTYTSIADADGNAITPNANGYFNAPYGELTVVGGNATDTCIHLTWSGYRNGEYEEYKKETMYFVDSTHDLSTLTGKLNGQGGSVQVFPDGLRSAGSVYDEVKDGDAVKRIGSQSVTGAIGDTITLTGCDTSATDYKAASDIGTLSGGVLTLTAAATAVEVLFPLASPETYVLDQTVNTQYAVDDFGTEKRLVEDTASAVQAPLLYAVRYAMNAVDTLRRLPQNYISKATMDNFCAELAAKLGAELNKTVTITATYDASDEEYDYNIDIT